MNKSNGHIIFLGAGILTGVALTYFISIQINKVLIRRKNEEVLSGLDKKVRRLGVRHIAECKKEGIELALIEGYRSCSKQNDLYAKGRTDDGEIVTNARCGESAHQLRLAYDAVPVINGTRTFNVNDDLWNKIGECGEKVGLTWGGRWNFKDKPHFQKLDGRSIKDLWIEYQNVA